jgi:RNA polymerase sigma-70 factor (ECF subfamily)
MTVMRAADPHVPNNSQATDAALAAAARTGDARALAALYHRYSRSLMAVAYRLLSSREDAEDVLHDVFVGLPEALRKYDERGRLQPWLTRVTARVALSRLRMERAERVVDVQPDVMANPSRTAPEELIALDTAIASLAPSLRAVLVLKEIEGFSHAEIAAMLGISKGASEVRLHRALVALRATLVQGGRER